MTRVSSTWVVPLTEQPARSPALRLLCLPFAGGGAATYRRWPRLLPAHVDVYAVQPPGRETRIGEPPIRRLDTLVTAMAEATRPYRGAPYALFGHSLGGLVAFELTRALRRRGEPLPCVLFVSGCAAPQLADAERSFAELDDAAFVERLRRFAGTPDAVLEDKELLALMLPTLRADLELRDGYRCADEPPLELPIVALGGEDDPDVGVAELFAWRAQTRAAFSVKRFAGGHFFLKGAPAPLLATVEAELACALGGTRDASPVNTYQEAARGSHV